MAGHMCGCSFKRCNIIINKYKSMSSILRSAAICLLTQILIMAKAMYKLTADYLTIGLWGISLSNTIQTPSFDSLLGLAQLLMSVLGAVYLCVKIYNEVSGQILDRERKRIENEMSLRELIEEENQEITK